MVGCINAFQLLEEQSGQMSKLYTYDAKGNITAIKQGTALLATYHFDETNKLVRSTQNNTTLQYKYNALGSSIKSNNQTTNQVQAYLIDLTSAYDNILAAYTDGVEVASYTYGLTRLYEQLASGDVHTYSYDHLGSVIGVQDEQGIVIGDYKYDAFGVLDAAHLIRKSNSGKWVVSANVSYHDNKMSYEDVYFV